MTVTVLLALSRYGAMTSALLFSVVFFALLRDVITQLRGAIVRRRSRRTLSERAASCRGTSYA